MENDTPLLEEDNMHTIRDKMDLLEEKRRPQKYHNESSCNRQLQ